MNMRRLLFLVILIAFLAIFASAQSAVGVLSYVEGEVSVTRSGEIVDARDVRIGMTIEEFDTLETGLDGYAEVEMNAPSAGSLVRVNADTAFYFEGGSSQDPKKQTLFQLLRGSLGLKVGRLTSRESYSVQTDTAVMAVRGTEFNVDMAADRSVLITVPEGRVESEVDNQTVIAEPGIIAAVDTDADLTALAIDAEDIELYREYWSNLRLEALKINAGLSIQQYARQWDSQLPRLESAMEQIASDRRIYDKWARVMRGEAEAPSLGEAIRDKRDISRGILELRAILPVAERTYHTLVGLEEAYRMGYAQGPFQAGSYSNARAFYRAFERDKAKMQSILAAARWTVRIYLVIDRATGGSGGLMTAPSL
jgi:hypothetical protein